MWWRVLACLLLAMASCWLVPSATLADSSEGVVVTATGYIAGAPVNFTVTYISDYEVGLSWTKGEYAERTLIRATIGRMPENSEDGYLVYYGDGESVTDTALNLDEIATLVYYRAWSENSKGVLEDIGADGSVGGIGMTLIAEAIFILGLSGLAMWRKNIILYTGSFLCLLLFGLNLCETSWMWGLGPLFLAAFMMYQSIQYWWVRRGRRSY